VITLPHLSKSDEDAPTQHADPCPEDVCTDVHETERSVREARLYKFDTRAEAARTDDRNPEFCTPSCPEGVREDEPESCVASGVSPLVDADDAEWPAGRETPRWRRDDGRHEDDQRVAENDDGAPRVVLKTVEDGH
jgi:hypothetical protein